MVSKSQQRRLAIQNPKRKPREWVGWSIATKIEPNRQSIVADEFFTKYNHAKRSLKLRLIPEDLEVIKVRIVEVV